MTVSLGAKNAWQDIAGQWLDKTMQDMKMTDRNVWDEWRYNQWILPKAT